MKSIKIVLVCLGLLLCNCVQAQEKTLVQFTVLDSESRVPVANPSIVFKGSGKDSLRIASGDSLGRISVQAAFSGLIRITVSSAGYVSKIVMIDLDTLAKSNAYANVIYLKAANQQLSSVTVTATKPLVKQEIDRLVYDVQADAESPSLSVLEMMAKVPLLSVDGDENIQLKGSSSYKIFINGRPSALTASNPKEALKAMRASGVLRIEVITTPPAKYDAEGMAGIINIVLKKQTVDGYNASVGGSYNTSVGTSQNASLTAKMGKWGITGTAYTFQDFRFPVTKEYNRQNAVAPYTSLQQQGEYSFVGNYQQGNVELSYELDSLNLLTGTVSFRRSDYDDRTTLTSVQTGAGAVPSQSYRTKNLNPQLDKTYGFDVNYQHGFRRDKNQLLTFSYQQRYLPYEQTNEVLFYDKNNYYQADYRQYNHNSTAEQTAQADFVKPFSKGNIEAGVKTIFRQVKSDAATGTENGLTGVYEPNPQLSNSLNYHQDIYGAYGSYYCKFKPFELKAGVRLEQTRIKADFKTNSGLLEARYTNVIPIVSLQHRFANSSSVKLAYTQRISRPGISQLNPFVDKLNPQFVSTGNPALRPVLSNNIELSYGTYKKANVNISLSYAFFNNAIQQVTTLSDSVSFTTYQNTGKNRTVGLNGSYSQSFSKTLSVSLNTQLTYLLLSGYFDGQNFSNRGMQGYVSMNWVYRFHPLWRVTTSLTFVSGSVVLQGHTNAYVFNSYRLYRDLFKKRLTVSLSTSNPYSKYRYIRTTIEGKGYRQQTTDQKMYRMFAITITYNFGSLKSSIKKNQRSINNDDVNNTN